MTDVPMTRVVSFTDKKKTKEGYITKEIKVSIEYGKWYCADKLSQNSEEKNLRKLLGLPITKSLVYYPRTYPSDRNKLWREKIIKYRICEIFEISDFWATLEIETEKGKIVKIHSDFLEHMQKSTFVKDMEEMYREM